MEGPDTEEDAMETLERCRTCGAALSGDIAWCGQCYTPVVTASRVQDDIVVLPETGEISIVHGGASTLSIWGKLAMTALLVGFGLVAFFALEGFTDVAGSAAWGFTVFFLVTYAGLALVALALTWRPGRARSEATGPRRERVIIVDGPLQQEVERRQQALRRTQDPQGPPVP